MGFSWSEVSRRYVKTEPEFYFPPMLRKGSDDIKQGSLDEPIADAAKELGGLINMTWRAMDDYRHLLACGVAAEQARMVLPQNAYTEWVWTGSLLGWARVWGLRVKPDAQRETKQVVEMIGPKMQELFPVSWEALTNV